jgi:hypothetical protein
MSSARKKIELAKRDLERVQEAWDPPDWADLSLYGFYALEAAVEAASLHKGMTVRKNHAERVKAAETLHQLHGLPDVSGLLVDLNERRKSEAYGDVDAPDLDAEDVASEIESYIDLVEQMLGE